MTTLKQLAINLEQVAQKYAAVDPDVQRFLDSLSDLISRAKNGEEISTDEHVPGRPWFSHGELSKYDGLESAHSSFSIFISEGSEKAYEDFLRDLNARLNK
jgi:hypothetical protein